MKAHVQTQEEWEAEMSLKILSCVRNEIYVDLRFLGVALSALKPRADASLRTAATDGAYFFFSSEQLLGVFRRNAPYLDRLYLHTVLHCIFSHLWIAPEEVFREDAAAEAGGRSWGGIFGGPAGRGTHGEAGTKSAESGGAAGESLMGSGGPAGTEARPHPAEPGAEAEWGSGGPAGKLSAEFDVKPMQGAGRQVAEPGMPSGQGTGGALLRLWNLACDIAVEYTIDGMDKPCTRRILTWTRQKLYGELADRKEGVSALVIYRMLKRLPPEEVEGLEREFFADDHRYWPKREDGAAARQTAAENRKKWEEIARETRLSREIRGDKETDGGEILAAQLKAAGRRRSYREFLRKFAVPREELRLDPDEFDLSYYTYGLRLYGNLPLIEPLESREDRKIREFIIVIDTSYSTSGELVGQFLRETADILMQGGSFFRDSKIRILQCDNAVREDAVICGEKDLKVFLDELRIKGGGGTDFRPAFSYVDGLLEKGECRNLCGLLYFTDGKGVYPKMRPMYKTAFLFLEDFDEDAVPPWAMRIRLEKEEFMDAWREGRGTYLRR